jgi:hypothetical protein
VFVSGRHDRGQALIETVIFLPVALIALFGIIFFSRYGVMSERAQIAVRYGALVAYGKGPAYSAADIYNAIAGGGAAFPTTCPANVVPATISALSEQHLPGPTPAPYWRPDSAAATCTQTTVSFAGPPWAAYHTLTVTNQTTTATLAVPAFLTTLLGASAVATTTFGYLRSDPPSVIMYCTGSGAAVAAALGAVYGGGGSC